MPSQAVTERLYRIIGERVRKRREELHLTQVQLAVNAGLARTSITNLEKGRQKVPLHQLLGIAEVLKVEVALLLPSLAELGEREALVQVSVGNLQHQVPPRTAQAINELLTEAPHAKARKG